MIAINNSSIDPLPGLISHHLDLDETVLRERSHSVFKRVFCSCETGKSSDGFQPPLILPPQRGALLLDFGTGQVGHNESADRFLRQIGDIPLRNQDRLGGQRFDRQGPAVFGVVAAQGGMDVVSTEQQWT